jgi:hypothetical protein
MQDRFLGPRITVGDIEKLRTLRHLKTLLQKELNKKRNEQGVAPFEILIVEQREKEVQKALGRLENHLFFIELCNQ